MRQLLYGILLALLLVPCGAEAQATWRIEAFTAELTIDADGSVLVREAITVDFTEQQHGIFRDLPVQYYGIDGERVYTTVSGITVTQDGQPAVVEVTSNSSNLRIRIGDPDATITGSHEYVLTYRVLGVLQAFGEYDELYWNVTGNGWEVPIAHASATVTAPAAVVQAACYAGLVGAGAEQCSELEQRERIVHAAAAALAPGEGLTVAVGFAPGAVPIVTVARPPAPSDVLFAPVTLAIALIGWLGGLSWLLSRWWRYGRDRYWQRAHLPGERSDRDGTALPEKILPLFFRQAVSVEYEPPDELRPAEIGVLMDERADTLDVSATIVDLAARGYLTITEVPKRWVFGKTDYQFTRLQKPVAALLAYERELLERLFGDEPSTTLSSLKNSFYQDLAAVQQSLYADVARKGLFAEPPDVVQRRGIVLALLAVLAGAIVLTASLLLNNRAGAAAFLSQLLAGVGAAVSATGISAALLTRSLPRKTGYGRELYQRARGYELFVSGTEKYRAKFYEDQGLFVRVLPYAIMFGVTDQLARAFKEMGVVPPQPAWFHGAGAFNAAQFATSMNSFSRSLSTAMAARPGGSGSGGGGFSGGGFGGGGGGSW